MSSQGFRRATFPIGLPTALVLLLWVGLWGLWPAPPRRAPAVSYRGLPGVWYLPRIAGGKTDAQHLSFMRSRGAETGLPEEDLPDDARLRHPASRARLFECRDREAPVSAAEAVAPLRAGVVRAPPGYRPAAPGPRVFVETKAGSGGVTVGVCGDLRQCGFEAPLALIDQARSNDAPWQATLFVQCAQDGRVEDVVVESGTSDAALNNALARAMYRATVATPGKRCSGRVTLSLSPR